MAVARRPAGTGAVYFDKDRDRWIGTVEAGWTKRGTRRRLKVSGRTEREARQKLRAKEREILLSGVPSEGTAAASTVKSWADRWLETHATQVRPASFSADRSLIRNWIVPTIGNKRLAQLSPGDMRAVTRAVLDAGKKPSTAARTHAVLGKLLRDAAIEGHHVPATVFLVRGVGATPSERDAIPVDDALKILAAAAERPDAARWILALMGGLRPAEALGLTWSALDLDDATLTLEWQLKALPYRVARDRTSGFRVPDGFKTRHLHDALHLTELKTRSGYRVIPLVPTAAKALRAWRDQAPDTPHDLVFPRADGRAALDKDDRAAWAALLTTAGVRDYDLYDARHTTATLLKVGGADDATITAILGHSSILSTKAYLHTDLTRARAALAAVEARLTADGGQGRP